MIGVSWVFTNPRLASARLRGSVPAAVLRSRGLICDGRDVIVASKHNWSVSKVRAATSRMIMDICDDHFDNPKFAQHYIDACNAADVITVNSAVMAAIVRRHTGREAVVIDDPYEDQELEPAAPPTEGGVLWFGHSLNLYTLEPYRDIPYELTVIDSSNWTPELIDAELRKCRCVLIPSGDKPAKSANRAIKAIRYGKFPVCGPLPAHDELGLGRRPILHVLDYAMHVDTSGLVMALQNKIRDRFSPETVADAWWDVFSMKIG